MQHIIVITGQTATGKTSYALRLAKKLNGELINADSRQIYKHLDIVTGKDLGTNDQFSMINDQHKSDGKTSEVKTSLTLEVKESGEEERNFTIGYYEIDGVKLWLYDVVDPKIPFSSYDYKVCARRVIENIAGRGKTPIIVGGTYLYIKHLLYGFETESIPPNWQLREELKDKSVEELADILRSTNDQMFKQLNDSDRKNPHRLIRKIEIARALRDGNPDVTSGEEKHKYDITQFNGLKFKNRDDLIAVITKRVEERLTAGAIDETKSLLDKGYTKHDLGLKTIGYKQLITHLEGNLSLEEAKKQWITAEVQYARRQYTFMKTDRNISWKTVTPDVI